MSVLTLAEVKDHLNISSVSFDAELQVFINRAEAAVASKCGPLASTAVTQKVRGYASSLSPRVTPILSLTSVTPTGGGTPIGLALLVTPEMGLRGPQTIEYLSPGGFFSSFWYDLVYNAGRAVVPDDLKLAALEGVRYYWQTQLGETALPAIGNVDAVPAMLGDAFPWLRVQHLVEPYLQEWL